MNVFRIRAAPGTDVDVFGRFECFFVGVDCPICTQWGSGLRYPTVGCAEVAALGGGVSVFLETEQRDGRQRAQAPMTVAQCESVRAQLEAVLGPKRPFGPGTSFGPVTGELRGTVHDFTWNASSMLLLRESVFDEIRAAGFPLAGARADLTFKTLKGRRWFNHEGPGEPLVELEVPPIASLVSSACKRCDLCGRTQAKGKIVIERDTVDQAVPIQSVYGMPGHFLATEPAAEFIRGRRYSGVKLSKQETNWS